MWASAGFKVPIHAHFFPWVILTHKVGQTDLICVCKVRNLCVKQLQFVPPKWSEIGFLFIDPCDRKNRSNLRWMCQLVHQRQMHLQCKFGDSRSVTCTDNAHTSFFYDDLKPRKVDWVICFPVRSGSLVDYKSLCALCTICATLVNIQTQTESIWPAYMKSSASRADKI